MLDPLERKQKIIEGSAKGKLILAPRYKKRGKLGNYNNKLGYIVGVLFGDGSVTDRGFHGSIQLKTTNLSFANVFFKALQDCGLNPKYHKRFYTKKFNKENRIYKNVEFHEVFYNSIYFVKNIQKNFGLTSTKEWEIDVDKVLSFGNEFCKALIKGLFDSEGSFWVGKNCRHAIEFSTTNKKGAVSFHNLLSKMGFIFNLNRTKREGFFEYKIRTGKKEVIKKFYDEIGFSIDYKQDRLRRFVLGEIPYSTSGKEKRYLG